MKIIRYLINCVAFKTSNLCKIILEAGFSIHEPYSMHDCVKITSPTHNEFDCINKGRMFDSTLRNYYLCIFLFHLTNSHQQQFKTNSTGQFIWTCVNKHLLLFLASPNVPIDFNSSQLSHSVKPQTSSHRHKC